MRRTPKNEMEIYNRLNFEQEKAILLNQHYASTRTGWGCCLGCLGFVIILIIIIASNCAAAVVWIF